MSSDTATETDRLDRIEQALARIEAKLAAAEQAFAGFVGGPAVAKMFRAIRGGN